MPNATVRANARHMSKSIGGPTKGRQDADAPSALNEATSAGKSPVDNAIDRINRICGLVKATRMATTTGTVPIEFGDPIVVLLDIIAEELNACGEVLEDGTDPEIGRPSPLPAA